MLYFSGIAKIDFQTPPFLPNQMLDVGLWIILLLCIIEFQWLGSQILVWLIFLFCVVTYFQHTIVSSNWQVPDFDLPTWLLLGTNQGC